MRDQGAPFKLLHIYMNAGSGPGAFAVPDPGTLVGQQPPTFNERMLLQGGGVWSPVPDGDDIIYKNQTQLIRSIALEDTSSG